MYTFEAEYCDGNTGEITTKEIKIDTTCFACTEGEAYMFAMTEAYKAKEPYQTLDVVRLISC